MSVVLDIPRTQRANPGSLHITTWLTTETAKTYPSHPWLERKTVSGDNVNHGREASFLSQIPFSLIVLLELVPEPKCGVR